jgi:CRP-like cAMP-binding protein
MLTQTAIRNVSQRQPATQPPRAPLPGAAMQTGTIELMGACMSFAANAEIYGENEPADYLYKVVSGTVRTYKVLVDGRRQIGAFHLPGDIFGFETIWKMQQRSRYQSGAGSYYATALRCVGSTPRRATLESAWRLLCLARLKHVNGPALVVGLRIGGEAGTADVGRWWTLTVAVLPRWNASPATSALAELISPFSPANGRMQRICCIGALAAKDNDVARQMWALTARELQRVQEHSLVLIKSAEERVAGFLLEMADRVPSGGAVELPMSRQDIADYLGLTIETVSRTLKRHHRAAFDHDNLAVGDRFGRKRVLVSRDRMEITRAARN